MNDTPSNLIHISDYTKNNFEKVKSKDQSKLFFDSGLSFSNLFSGDLNRHIYVQDFKERILTNWQEKVGPHFQTAYEAPGVLVISTHYHADDYILGTITPDFVWNDHRLETSGGLVHLTSIFTYKSLDQGHFDMRMFSWKALSDFLDTTKQSGLTPEQFRVLAALYDGTFSVRIYVTVGEPVSLTE